MRAINLEDQLMKDVELQLRMLKEQAETGGSKGSTAGGMATVSGTSGGPSVKEPSQMGPPVAVKDASAKVDMSHFKISKTGSKKNTMEEYEKMRSPLSTLDVTGKSPGKRMATRQGSVHGSPVKKGVDASGEKESRSRRSTRSETRKEEASRRVTRGSRKKEEMELEPISDEELDTELDKTKTITEDGKRSRSSERVRRSGRSRDEKDSSARGSDKRKGDSRKEGEKESRRESSIEKGSTRKVPTPKKPAWGSPAVSTPTQVSRISDSGRQVMVEMPGSRGQMMEINRTPELVVESVTCVPFDALDKLPIPDIPEGMQIPEGGLIVEREVTFQQHPPSSFTQPPPTSFSQPPPTSFTQAPPTSLAQPTPSNYTQPPPTSFVQPAPTSFTQALPTSFTQAPPTNFSQTTPVSYTQPPPTSFTQPPPTDFSRPPPNFTQPPPTTVSGNPYVQNQLKEDFRKPRVPVQSVQTPIMSSGVVPQPQATNTSPVVSMQSTGVLVTPGVNALPGQRVGAIVAAPSQPQPSVAQQVVPRVPVSVSTSVVSQSSAMPSVQVVNQQAIVPRQLIRPQGQVAYNPLQPPPQVQVASTPVVVPRSNITAVSVHGQANIMRTPAVAGQAVAAIPVQRTGQQLTAVPLQQAGQPLVAVRMQTPGQPVVAVPIQPATVPIQHATQPVAAAMVKTMVSYPVAGRVVTPPPILQGQPVAGRVVTPPPILQGQAAVQQVVSLQQRTGQILVQQPGVSQTRPQAQFGAATLQRAQTPGAALQRPAVASATPQNRPQVCLKQFICYSRQSCIHSNLLSL